MKTINIDTLSDQAQRAATSVIDDSLSGYTNKNTGPCGDRLAAKLTTVIRDALTEMFEDESESPAFFKKS